MHAVIENNEPPFIFDLEDNGAQKVKFDNLRTGATFKLRIGSVFRFSFLLTSLYDTPDRDEQA